MIRLAALAVLLCYGVDFNTDILGRGTALRRTEPYAQQEAICNAKDDAKRQCLENNKKPFFYYASLVSNDCVHSGDEWSCTAVVCGTCLEEQP